MAHLWHLQRESFSSEFKKVEIPHVKHNDEHTQDKAVHSVHWNAAGDKLLTSCEDHVARVWKVDS